MQHQVLENGRWAQLTFPQQMANIGSETSRIYRALEAGKDSRAESAFARLQELVDLTIKYGRSDASPMLRSALLEELCRFRELYCKAYLERDLSELAAFNRYLDKFAKLS
ncbi:hypothetical protein SAMN06298215_1736 [Bacteroidales bacterium WCE2008]|nr:hypothetical protein SAMN06298215_1736 [Bacteroidales bacterium WCE2008]